MPDPIITVEGLGKKYSIRHERNERYTALRDVIANSVSAPFRRMRNGRQRDNETTGRRDQSPVVGGQLSGSPSSVVSSQLSSSPRSEGGQRTEEFWALKDINFEVKQGEVLGIIGRNGAGKSTLLKILSRITDPTEGRVRIKGRVASLLEVGTGFHPELTGRENIYLNGAILGMGRNEIKAKFDEIVDFAEIEKFLDTPVKRYSSGMYVRLAFAVAAHLEPEILVIDEVLAVGDAEFQKKCIGKMEAVSHGGRSVLFVSHDMRNISRLCDTGILLDRGALASKGAIATVIAHYVGANTPIEGYAELADRGDRSGSGDARFLSIETMGDSRRCTTFSFGSELRFHIRIDVKVPLGRGHIAVLIATEEGIPVHGLENFMEGMRWDGTPGQYEVDVTVSKLRLFPGAYLVHLWIGDHHRERVDYLMNAIGFQVVQTRSGGVSLSLDRSNGLVFQESRWSCKISSPDRVAGCP